MAIEFTIYADASRRAVEAFRGMPEFDGDRYLFPYKTDGVATPPMGLLAVRDSAWRCLEREALPTDDSAPPRWSIAAPPHPGLPPRIWGPGRYLYPEPSLVALGVLRELAARTGARVWLACEHERGDTPYDQWVWLFAPPRPRRAGYEAVFAYGGDAGQILWQRDLVGPDPWRVLADAPGGSPLSRMIRHLELRGDHCLPAESLRWYDEFALR